jgi:uncharacterized Zn-finger protein
MKAKSQKEMQMKDREAELKAMANSNRCLIDEKSAAFVKLPTYKDVIFLKKTKDSALP